MVRPFIRALPLVLALLASSRAHAFDLADLEQLWKITPPPTLEAVLAKLPEALRHNVTFKYSNGFDDSGEMRPSLSASAQFPRAFAWDESSGFVVSFNGAEDQDGYHDLEFMRWLPERASFLFQVTTFPNGAAAEGPRSPATCKHCHGTDLRPIWKMYPLWPGLFGSINDELVAKTAPDPGDAKHAGEDAAAYRDNERIKDDERSRYDVFTTKAKIAPSHARYRPFFPDGAPATYPFRPDSMLSPADTPSRAFSLRPNLRIGIMLNRMNALRVMRLLKADPIYTRFKELFLYNLVDCGWDVGAAKKASALAPLKTALAEMKRDVDLDTVTAPGAKKDVNALFAMVGLALMDVDIRATHTASAKKVYARLGYYDSYFDGSATTNELLAHLILQDLSRASYEEGLTSKYAHLKRRFVADREFFAEMDALAKWFPLPYPPEKFIPEHREKLSSRAVTARQQLCAELAP